jgi:prophage regulatory protein
MESMTVRKSHSRLAVARSAEAPRLFARLPTVMQATGLGRSTIYRLVASGAFPAPVHLGPRAVAWRWSDLDQWERVARRRLALTPARREAGQGRAQPGAANP